MKLKRGQLIKGECLCHGIEVQGPAFTVAAPRPYWHQDLWTGARIKCVAVVEPSTDPRAQPHDIPLSAVRLVTVQENDD